MAENEPGQDPIGEDPRVASLKKRIAQVEQAERIRTGGVAAETGQSRSDAPVHDRAAVRHRSLVDRGYNIAFTNSALWMAITAWCCGCSWLGGMKRQLVPGRWQMAVESFTGFIDNLLPPTSARRARSMCPTSSRCSCSSCSPTCWACCRWALVGMHPFTFTSHFTVTGVLAILSFSIVLIVGFWKHGLHFFSLFVPHGTPLPMIPADLP
jgi:F0F1-type ATP synthase membrane subunit a